MHLVIYGDGATVYEYFEGILGNEAVSTVGISSLYRVLLLVLGDTRSDRLQQP
ncbi:MAG: hypothetical protein AAFQ89_21190 [Cyanobacteria bacterium J06626_18]